MLVSVQGLHRFYQRRTNEVIASWMTRQDRELAIADNLAYVEGVIDAASRDDRPRAATVGVCGLLAGRRDGVFVPRARRPAASTESSRSAATCRRRSTPPRSRASQTGARLSRRDATSGIRTTKFQHDITRLRESGVTVHAGDVRRRARVVGCRSEERRHVSAGARGGRVMSDIRQAVAGRRASARRAPVGISRRPRRRRPKLARRSSIAAPRGCRWSSRAARGVRGSRSRTAASSVRSGCRCCRSCPIPPTSASSHAYISNVYVTPSARGGVGTRLLRTALDWAASNRIDRVVLWPTARSRSMYQRHGFRRERRRARAHFVYRPHPLDHSALNVVVDRRLRGRILARELERVVAAGHHVDRRRRSDGLDDRRELRRRTERVARALHEQHRPANRRQMFVPALGRTSWRVERVAEQHQARDRQRRIGGRDLRGDSPAHRLAADEQARASALGSSSVHRCNHRAVTRLEDRRAIRNASALFRVGKVEGDHVHAEGRDGAGEVDHERAALTARLRRARGSASRRTADDSDG